MAENVRIGIIGGSGLYAMDALSNVSEINVDTPFGKPSAAITVGSIAGSRVAFLARHGKGHVLNPTEVPYRANIWALKSIGVEYIVAVSACGSLRERFAPGHVVIPDQLIDFTKGKRDVTFYENGLVAHVGVADPFCQEIRAHLAEAVYEAGGTVHYGGNFITVEGPRFSTRGESNLFRAWGMDIIGMTTSPEAFLAREAEICYAVMAHVTDYDVWHEEEEAVSAEAVIKQFNSNLRVAQNSIMNVIPKLAGMPEKVTEAHRAFDGALTTKRHAINPVQHAKLRIIIGD
ncbi:MAG: S-methyl-5'-thioadenosine phosphorylase [Chloroflexi bacterium]|nr:S-methyl-5'-thioadenosine phosphorylase [Chloroflexota bacterium]